MHEIVRAVSASSSLIYRSKHPIAFISKAAANRQITDDVHRDLSWYKYLSAHMPSFDMRSALRANQQNDIRLEVEALEQHLNMESALLSLLEATNQSDLHCGLSQDFVRGLLMESNAEIRESNKSHCEGNALHQKLQGLPKRPLYREIARRLNIIQQHDTNNPNEKDNMLFFPADHFGMTELETMETSIPPTNDLSSAEECTKWLRQAGEKGILSLLGIRRTVGTASISSNETGSELYLLPAPVQELINASCQLHKPNSKSSLTVGARALAKHADRGQSGFYGSIQGSEAVKNEHAMNVVEKLIAEAAWVNIHMFGGADATRPILEVRTQEGYGARWSAVWKDAFTPVDVAFRGFLEPHMENGHERRWRH